MKVKVLPEGGGFIMDVNREETEARELSGLDGLLDRAGHLLGDGHFDDAVGVLREAIEQFPDSPLPRHDLSVAYFSRLRGKYDHLEVWGDLSDEEAFFEAAVREAKASLEIDDDFVPGHNNLATLFALRGWWKEAEQHWEISLTLQPDQSLVRQDMVAARKHIN